MPDRAKLMDGLRCRCAYFPERDCARCHYGIQMGRRWGCDFMRMAGDAATLLKAQEPRVLTYDEARNNAMEFMNPDSIKPLFIEFRTKDDDDEEGLRPPWRGGYNQRMMLLHSKDRYGVEFRFWNDRPSAEQMEAVPWEAKAENAGS